jgi:thiol-disulfide isomerase/thioredoxin
MADRKPSPYATFNVYNGSMAMKETKEVINTAKPLPQQPVRENFKGQSQQNKIPEIQPRQSQNHVQNQSQLQQPQPSRFKSVQTSEHLYNVLKNGLEKFQSNFTSNNMTPPPMKMFLKLYTEWCNPCKKIKPVLDEISISEEYKDIIFLQFDADLMMKGQDQYSKELIKYLKVGAVPAFFGFVDGNLIDTVMGADVNEIQLLLNKIN